MLSKAVPINKVTCGSQNLTVSLGSTLQQLHYQINLPKCLKQPMCLVLLSFCMYPLLVHTIEGRSRGFGYHPEDWYRVCLPAAESEDLKNTVLTNKHTHTHTLLQHNLLSKQAGSNSMPH